MPGITGYITDRNDPSVFNRMLRQLDHHEYVTEKYCEKGVHLGRVHLGYINTGQQPFFSEDKRFAVLFQGEIFSYSGEDLPESADFAKYFLDLYIRYGNDFLSNLNAQFSACIYDFPEEKLSLYNDRFGTRPLYYSQVPGGFVFAPEVKALLVRQEDKQINYKAVSDLFHFGHLWGYDTMFDKIYQLPEATVLTYKNGRYKLIRYWDYPDDDKFFISRKVTAVEEHVLYDSLKSVITIAMKRQFKRNKSDILMPLSGGLDSRYLVAFARQSGVDPLIVFTMGPDESEDQMYARQVAEKVGAHHHPYIIEPRDIWANAGKYAYLSDGMSLISGSIQGFSPYMFFFRKRKILIITQVIDAIFGSTLWRKRVRELMAAKPCDPGIHDKMVNFFNRFPEQLLQRVFTEEYYLKLKGLYRTTPEKYASSGHLPINIYFKMLMNEYCRRGILGGNVLCNTLYESRMPTYDNELLELGYTLPFQLRKNQYLYRKVFTELFPELSAIKREFYNLPIDASDFRINSSILKFKVITTLKTTPANYLIRRVQAWNRPDYVNYPEWLRNELWIDLNDFFSDLLTSSGGVFRKDALDRLLDEHRSGKYDHTALIWQIINLEYFYRNFIA